MIDKVKSYIAPFLVSILGTLIWADVQDIKNKLDILMQERSGVSERLKYIERDIQELKQPNYKKTFNIVKPIVFIKDDKFSEISNF